MDIVQLLEIGMLITFGFSWPFNIYKSVTSRTAKGKSLLFEIIIIVGYCMGVTAKFVTYSRTGVLAYSVWFYFLDICLVMTDLILSLRNLRLDREREMKAGKRN